MDYKLSEYESLTLVIVDGIGCKPTLSIRHVCKPYNHHANKKRIAKFKARLALKKQQQTPNLEKTA
jgi:hypothetical protein